MYLEFTIKKKKLKKDKYLQIKLGKFYKRIILYLYVYVCVHIMYLHFIYLSA